VAGTNTTAPTSTGIMTDLPPGSLLTPPPSETSEELCRMDWTIMGFTVRWPTCWLCMLCALDDGRSPFT
jgi:hypothetical protein